MGSLERWAERKKGGGITPACPLWPVSASSVKIWRKKRERKWIRNQEKVIDGLKFKLHKENQSRHSRMQEALNIRKGTAEESLSQPGDNIRSKIEGREYERTVRVACEILTRNHHGCHQVTRHYACSCLYYSVPGPEILAASEGIQCKVV